MVSTERVTSAEVVARLLTMGTLLWGALGPMQVLAQGFDTCFKDLCV